MKNRFFLIAFGLLIVAAMFWFSLRKNVFVLYVKMDDASGLHEYDAVMMNGAEAGEVHSLKLSGNKVIVEVEIYDDIEIPCDSRFVVESLTLLGGRQLTIKPGTDASRYLKNSDTVICGQTEAPAIIAMPQETVAKKLPALADTVSGLLERLKEKIK